MNKKGVHETMLNISKIKLIINPILLIITIIISLLLYNDNREVIERGFMGKTENSIDLVVSITYILLFVCIAFNFVKIGLWETWKSFKAIDYINKKNYRLSIEKVVEKRGRDVLFQNERGEYRKHKIKSQKGAYRLFNEGEEYFAVYLNNQKKPYMTFETNLYYDDSTHFVSE